MQRAFRLITIVLIVLVSATVVIKFALSRKDVSHDMVEDMVDGSNGPLVELTATVITDGRVSNIRLLQLRSDAGGRARLAASLRAVERSKTHYYAAFVDSRDRELASSALAEVVSADGITVLSAVTAVPPGSVSLTIMSLFADGTAHEAARTPLAIHESR
jgi:hypothetical protein